MGNENDCVSRQAVKEMMCIKHCTSFHTCEQKYGCYKTHDLELLPPVQPEPHWMPVSERCPDKAGMYLITNYDGYVFLHYYDGEDSSKKFWKSYIKAWMPLPEPYQKEGE